LPIRRTFFSVAATACFSLPFLVASSVHGQSTGGTVGKAAADVQQAAKSAGQSTKDAASGALGTKTIPTGDAGKNQSGNAPAPSGTDSTSASKPASAGENAASAKVLKLGPLDPSTPPTNVPHNRPIIGLAMGGGAALAFTEIGTLQWMEEHHIPIDVIAGTSMGSILSALYSTGHTPEQMQHILTDNNVSGVFRISSDYSALDYRRREEERQMPSGLTVGLRHGVSLRNSLLTDTGLNELLDREFLAYNDQTDFNNLPIPFRCQATDLNAAKTVTFARGSLQDAVRASASIPGVFRPFQLNGHEFVDGAVLENLPTPDVRAMGANVVIAISLPLAPVGKGDLDSILGVLQRAFSVGIEANEARDRKLADVVIMPDITGFTANDYLATKKLADRGYAAAEAHKDELLKYAVSQADWDAYLAHKAALQRPAAGNVIQVKVRAPTQQVADVTQTIFQPIIGKPVDPDEIEKKLAILRADGRYDADYTVGYALPEVVDPNAGQYAPGSKRNKRKSSAVKPPSTAALYKDAPKEAPPNSVIAATPAPAVTAPAASDPSVTVAAPPDSETSPPTDHDPIILVSVDNKKTGPPFLSLGLNIESQSGGDTRATFASVLNWQDLGGYGSGLRVYFDLGYLTRLESEYYWKPQPLGHLFLAPRANITRQTYYIYQGNYRLSERQSQFAGIGGDAGYTDGKYQELRLGWLDQHVSWNPTVGFDSLPNYNHNSQMARARYVFDNQDRALVPRSGLRAIASAGYLYDTPGSPSAPKFTGELKYAYTISPKNTFAFNAEGGTFLNHDVAQPFRFTLGGPLRLAASSIDQYRGTDYFLVTPGYLRRIATLPAPLGNSIYVGGTYEFGQMRAPDMSTLNREDFYIGIVAETPFGVITLAPAFGDHGERKFVFTLGRFF
jgi:NTE family protein